MLRATKVRIYPTLEQAEFLNRQFGASRRYGWLGEADSIALQQATINIDTAFQNFFDPKLQAKFPRFKSKYGRQSSYHCTSVSAGDNWIKVPKCEPVKAKVHREITGKIKSTTLSRETRPDRQVLRINPCR